MASRVQAQILPRKLTQAEIDHIIDSLDYIRDNSYLTPEISRNVKAQQTHHVREQLAEIVIRPDCIPQMIEMINAKLEKALIPASTPVGTRASQILASSNTQKALDLFNGKETLQVDSFSRVLDCARKMAGVTTNIYFVNPILTVDEIIRKYGSVFVHTTLKDIARFKEVTTETAKHPWHDTYIALSDELTPPTYPVYLRIPLDKYELVKRNMSTYTVAKKINEQMKICCIPSPDSMSELHIFADNINLDLPAGKTIEDFPRAIHMYLEYTLLQELLGLEICGIRGITDWTFIKEEAGGFSLLLMGGNIFELMAVDGVDPQRIFSTSMWEMYDAFGIEGVFYMIMRLLGGDTNTSVHLLLLASAITADGYPRGMNRFGLNSMANTTDRALYASRLFSACGSATKEETMRYANLCRPYLAGRKNTNAFARSNFEAMIANLPKSAERQEADNATTSSLGPPACGALKPAFFTLSSEMDIE